MTGMTIDEVTKALTRGCCSRQQAADKLCDLCGPRYEAIDQVIRWHDTLDEATAYAREMSAHALESARKRYEAQAALANAWALLTGKPMEQPVSMGGGGYVDLNVPNIVEASNKAAEVVARAEKAEAERDEALAMLAALTKAADQTGLTVYPHPLTIEGQRAVVELARTIGDAGAVVARLSRRGAVEGAGRRLVVEAMTVVADASSREVCCEDHERGVAEAHELCCATGRAAEARARMPKEREAEIREDVERWAWVCAESAAELLAELDAERERAEKAEAKLAALREAVTARAQCWEHANACCREWCDRCQAEVRSDDALESAIGLASADTAAASYRARVEAEVLEAMEAKMREASKNALEDSRGSGGSIATGRHFAWERAAELLETEAVKRKRGAR